MYQSFLLALNRVHPRTWDFVQLMRLEKPIGIYLLLWPTLWALWVASKGGIDALRATALPPQPAFAQSVLGGERIRKRIRRGQVLGFNI